MALRFQRSFFPWIALLLPLAGCDGTVDYTRYKTDLKTGDTVSLYEWPDSVYIAEIDRKLTEEPLTEEARKKRSEVAISITPGAAPVLPPEIGRPVADREKGGVRHDPGSPSPAKGSTPASRKETGPFVPRFVAALETLMIDPSARGVSIQVGTRSGETLRELLIRTYGADAGSLPMSVVSYQLRLVNPGIDFEKLEEGAELLLPRL